MTQREDAHTPLNEEFDEREDLIDPDGVKAASDARKLIKLGSLQNLDENSVQFSIRSNELRMVARATDYAGVRTPKKKHNQHTYIAISNLRICFKTTRSGSSCAVTFALDSDLGAKLPNEVVAFELEPHVLPAIVSIDGGKQALFLQYDRRADTLTVETKDHTNKALFTAVFGTKRVEPDLVFGRFPKSTDLLGIKQPEALRRGLEFASLLCREEAGTKIRRGVTIRDGLAFGGYNEGIGWCSHPAFAGIHADLRFNQVADVCRLLSRLSTSAETWLDEERMTFTDGPIVCTCDIAKPSLTPPAVGQSAHSSVIVNRKSVFYQASLFASVSDRTGRESAAMQGSVGGDAEALLELQAGSCPKRSPASLGGRSNHFAKGARRSIDSLDVLCLCS